MKKDKFQITMPELQKLIKEEYASMAKDASRAEEIQARLKAINEELETLPETLSEVEASGTKKVKSTGWTGEGEGDVKYGEKFEKIGTHLKEDEEFEGEIEVGGEDAMDSVEAEPEMGYFEMKFAELGKELDAKVGGEEEGAMDEMSMEPAAEEPMEGLAEMEETKHEPMEGESVNPEALAEEAVEEGVEVVAEETIEEVSKEGVEEGAEVVAEETIEEVVKEVSKEGVEEETIEEVSKEGVEETISEDLEEPIEGSTPAQDSDARFNDYMEKDKHVNESVKKGTTLLSEGFTPERKSKMDAELERMKRLAKI
jgi:hypothetical protein